MHPPTCLCWAQTCPDGLSPLAPPGYPGQKHPSPTSEKQQGSAAPAFFAQSISVITVCWFNDLRGERVVGKRTSLES